MRSPSRKGGSPRASHGGSPRARLGSPPRKGAGRRPPSPVRAASGSPEANPQNGRGMHQLPPKNSTGLRPRRSRQASPSPQQNRRSPPRSPPRSPKPPGNSSPPPASARDDRRSRSQNQNHGTAAKAAPQKVRRRVRKADLSCEASQRSQSQRRPSPDGEPLRQEGEEDQPHSGDPQPATGKKKRRKKKEGEKDGQDPMPGVTPKAQPMSRPETEDGADEREVAPGFADRGKEDPHGHSAGGQERLRDAAEEDSVRATLEDAARIGEQARQVASAHPGGEAATKPKRRPRRPAPVEGDAEGEVRPREGQEQEREAAVRDPETAAEDPPPQREEDDDEPKKPERGSPEESRQRTRRRRNRDQEAAALSPSAPEAPEAVQEQKLVPDSGPRPKRRKKRIAPPVADLAEAAEQAASEAKAAEDAAARAEAVEEEGASRRRRRRRRDKDDSDDQQEEAQEAAVEDAALFPEVNARFSELIRGVYKRQNPAKMNEVESLLEKYRGMEAELYNRVCEKYGEQPEDVDAQPGVTASDAPFSVSGGATAAPRGFAKKASAPAPPGMPWTNPAAPPAKPAAPVPPPPPPSAPPKASSRVAVGEAWPFQEEEVSMNSASSECSSSESESEAEIPEVKSPGGFPPHADASLPGAATAVAPSAAPLGTPAAPSSADGAGLRFGGGIFGGAPASATTAQAEPGPDGEQPNSPSSRSQSRSSSLGPPPDGVAAAAVPPAAGGHDDLMQRWASLAEPKVSSVPAPPAEPEAFTHPQLEAAPPTFHRPDVSPPRQRSERMSKSEPPLPAWANPPPTGPRAGGPPDGPPGNWAPGQNRMGPGPGPGPPGYNPSGYPPPGHRMMGMPPPGSSSWGRPSAWGSYPPPAYGPCSGSLPPPPPPPHGGQAPRSQPAWASGPQSSEGIGSAWAS